MIGRGFGVFGVKRGKFYPIIRDEMRRVPDNPLSLLYSLCFRWYVPYLYNCLYRIDSVIVTW